VSLTDTKNNALDIYSLYKLFFNVKKFHCARKTNFLLMYDKNNFEITSEKKRISQDPIGFQGNIRALTLLATYPSNIYLASIFALIM